MATIADELKVAGSKEIRGIILDDTFECPEINEFEMETINGETFPWENAPANINPQSRAAGAGITTALADLESKTSVVGIFDTELKVDAQKALNYAKGSAAYLATQTLLAVSGYVKALCSELYKGNRVGGVGFDGILADLEDISGADDRVITLAGATADKQSSIVFLNKGEQGVKFVGTKLAPLTIAPWQEDNAMEMPGGGTVRGHKSRIDGRFGLSIGHRKCIGAARNVEVSKITEATVIEMEDLIDVLGTENALAKPTHVSMNRQVKRAIERVYKAMTNEAISPKLEDVWGLKILVTDALPFNEAVIV